MINSKLLLFVYIVAYKEGKPDDRELDEMAGKICSKWQELGLRLDISQDKLDEIDANEKRTESISDVTSLEKYNSFNYSLS